MAHNSNRGGAYTVMRVRLDGSVPPVEWVREAGQSTATAWSPDGRYVLAATNVPGNGIDVRVFPSDDPTKITPLLTGPSNDYGSTFSPDGRWIAFVSDRSGRLEVYAVRFHGEQSPPMVSGQPIQITPDGGGLLNNGWRRDGKEIVFGSANGQIMAVSVDSHSESLSMGRPVALFGLPIDRSAVAVTPAADRFLVSERPYTAGQTIHVLTNWRERLSQRK